jgi:hypothetical protein
MVEHLTRRKSSIGTQERAFLPDCKTNGGQPKSKGTLQTEKWNSRIYLSEFERYRVAAIPPKQIKDWLSTNSEGLKDEFRQMISAMRFGRPYSVGLRSMKWAGGTITDFEAALLEPSQEFVIPPKKQPPAHLDPLRVLACPALRVSEALGLLSSDFDFKQTNVSIRVGTPQQAREGGHRAH